MKACKRLVALLLAVTLVLTSTIVGLVLPVAAEGDTFKLAKDHIYVAPGSSGGYVTYVAVPPVTLDGQPYTETVTWKTSSSSKLAISSSEKGIFKTVKNTSGDVTITATNAAGESHSCTVTIAWDGEVISGGDFESLACQTGFTSDRWKNIIKSGKGQVVQDPDDPSNHVLKMPAGLSGDMYYSGLAYEKNTTYVLSFDLKGDTGEIKPVYISTSNATGTNNWQFCTPKADQWKHYTFKFTTTDRHDPNYVFMLRNDNITNGTNTNPVYYDNVSLYKLGSAESVALNETELKLAPEETSTLTLTPTPADATMNRVVWSTSDPSVATVDANGKVTAIEEGTATITAKSGLLKQTCEVIVARAKLEGIKFDKTELILGVGKTDVLTVLPVPDVVNIPDDAEIVWETGDEEVATVVDGVVTAKAPGTATITATLGDFSASCEVEVSSDSFMFEKDHYYFAPKTDGYSVYQGIPVKKLDGSFYTEALTWTTSNANVCKVYNSTSGLLEAMANGTATITATNEAGESHSVKVTVCFDGERISDGTFDSNAGWNVSKWKSEILYESAGRYVVEDPDDPTNKVLQIPGGTGTKYYNGAPITTETKYMVSFDVKGTPSSAKFLYINPSYCSGSTGWKTVSPKADEWKHYSYVFTTKAKADCKDGTLNRNYVLGIANDASANLYIDNFSLVQLGTAESITMNAEEYHLEIGGNVELSVAPTPEDATMNRVEWSSSDEEIATVDANGKVTAWQVGTVTITAKSGILTATSQITVHEELINAAPAPDVQNGTIETDAVIGELKPEDIVTVNVTPDEGYLMIPGSLCYVMKDGTKVKILNQSMTDFTFGGGTGNTFEFIMPEGAVSVTAEFAPTTEQTFQMQTIGTSVHYTGLDNEGNPNYDGVRFLTRMNLAVTFDENTNALTVLYNGKEYTVEELGSLLKREENDTALTYENAVANTSSSGAGKMWVSKAYTKDSGLFKLVDYTDSYIDFVSVMMTKYLERFYTARGYAILKDAEGNTETILYDEITNSISTVVKILPPEQTLEGVTAEKWSPYTESITVEPGEKLTYTIKVTNNGTESGPVTVFDPIPENTTYVEGADDIIGKTAVWTVQLTPGETKEVQCTVQVKDDKNLCNGGVIEATNAQVGEDEVVCDNTLYIERSVSKYDEYFVNNVIKALGDASFKELGLVYRVEYQSYTSAHTAFRRDSGYNGLTGEAVLDAVIHGDGVATYTYTNSSNKSTTATVTLLDMIAPTLYGGAEVTGQIAGVKGAPADAVTEDNLMIGDVIIVKNNDTVSMYIYCDRGLLLLKPTGGTEKANMAILGTLTTSEAYLVLRWRAGLTSVTSTSAETKPVELTKEQEAVIKTGEAFLMRGEKVQYADTSLAANADYRWAIEQVSPEDASAINWKYTNCAAFCYDSYYFGLNYKLGGGNLYTTANMAKNTTMRLFNLPRAVEDTYTEEEKATLSAQFLDTLQPGDLMVIRRSSGSGHVMMYIGNGKMIHSTGSNYNYTYSREFYEPSIAYGQVKDYFLNPTASNYLFGHPEDTSATQSIQICILRPLSQFTKEVPENTTNRINNLTGVVAQKVASHNVAKTVNAGENITYTYNLRNTNDKAVTLAITDVVPANTTYVSGAQTVDGDNLAWTVTVPADDTLEVSFTVKVNDDVATGTLIQSTAGTVGGVKFTTRDITVANTLTEAQQEAIKTAFNELVAEGTELRDFELVNAVYERALGVSNVFASTDSLVIGTDETDGVFDATTSTNTPFQLATEGQYREMLAPTMYGGRKVDSDLWDKNRIRLPKQEHVVVGDVLIYRTSSSTIIYFYTGERFMKITSSITTDSASANSRLAYTLAVGNYFCVLRPSMTMEMPVAE